MAAGGGQGARGLAHKADAWPSELSVLLVMRDLVRDGMTLVVVAHEMGFARDVAHRILFMDQGRILERAAPREFFDHPQHPGAWQFLADIRTPDRVAG